MLKVHELQTFYGRSQALFDVSLDVAEGEAVTLLGRNGMGKTTTLNSIMGIVTPAAGDIEFCTKSVVSRPAFYRAQRGIALVPEGRQVFPNLSVRENLIATARKSGSGAWELRDIYTMFPILEERASFMGNLLSGGEQQMLAIGRALMTNPKLLLLDDATEGLAPLVRLEIWRSLWKLKERGLSMVIVDKNIRELGDLADHHYVLERGRVVWQGSSAALSSDTELQQRYLGL